MVKIAYLDAPSGISGDMLIAALLDAGVDESAFRATLGTLNVGAFDLTTSRVMRASISGLHADIRSPEKQPERHLHHVERILNESQLPAGVRTQALAIFTLLAEVEGRLHGKPPKSIHFHEVGAVDAILDIAGACLGLHMLGIERLYCSPLNVGSGRVEAAHGVMPVPAPATAELLKGIPVYSTGIEAELVTPTGAALVASLAAGFGPMPRMRVQRIGYGAGARDFPRHANIARLMVGAEEAEPAQAQTGIEAAAQTVSVIEATLDDMTAQLAGHCMEQAFTAGALDVTLRPVYMKKNRPGFELVVLAAPGDEEKLVKLIFEQTTTLGVRIFQANRRTLERAWTTVATPYGDVRMKLGSLDGRVVNAAPEYEDCRQLAEGKSVPLKEVMQAAHAAYRNRR